MRLSLALIVALLAASAAWAEDPPACPEVEIGAAQTYACLNQRLQHFANPPGAPGVLSTPSASDPANKTGSASEAGTRERLGRNFGKTAIPQRPAATVFPPPLR